MLWRHFAKIFIYSYILIVASTALSETSPEGEIVWLPYPDEGIVLGQGFNLMDNTKAAAICVRFKTKVDKGYETTYNISHLDSFAEAFSAFEVSASGQLDLALLSAKSNLQFTNSARKLSDSERYALTVRVRRGARHATPVSSGSSSEPADAGPAWRVSFRELNLDLDQTFDEACGTHYVGTILEGVDLKAVLTTLESNVEGNTSFSGSVEVNVAEIFKGKGSIAATLKNTEKALQANLDSHILGGEKYELPTDVPGLTAFAKQMTAVHSDSSPRPMLIGLVPYSSLGSKGSAFELAETLGPAIFAYFTAREARDRLILAVNHRQKQLSGLVLMDEIGLFREIDYAYRKMINLRQSLRTCRELLLEINEERAVKAAEKVVAAEGDAGGALDLAAVYTAMVESAEIQRSDALKATFAGNSGKMSDAELQFQDTDGAEVDVAESEPDKEKDLCLVGLSDTLHVREATRVFLRSLALMPLYPEDLKRDPYVSFETLGNAAKAVAESGNSAVGQLTSRIADLREQKWQSCNRTRLLSPAEINEAMGCPAPQPHSGGALFMALGLDSIPRPSESCFDPTVPITETVTDEACEARFDSQIKEAEAEAAQIEVSLKQQYEILVQAIGRHVYRAHYNAARNSICGDELRHEICWISYDEAVASFVSTFQISPAQAKSIADTLLPKQADDEDIVVPGDKTTGEDGKPKVPRSGLGSECILIGRATQCS